ncbi:hypothetical protein PO124_10285 [Bacillus licheniformis]|nr:hypothetical protein [Bacillus licheniformis]
MKRWIRNSQVWRFRTRGITRLLYSPEWIAAVRELEATFKEEGLEVSFDDVGNLSGRLVGSKYPEETI